MQKKLLPAKIIFLVFFLSCVRSKFRHLSFCNTERFTTVRINFYQHFEVSFVLNHMEGKETNIILNDADSDQI